MCAVRSKEQFDLNSVTLTGVVQKLWGRSQDVYARLRVSQRGLAAEPEDAQACYVTLRFPDGNVAGAPLTLQPETLVRVCGYLTHTHVDESLRKFLEAAHAPEFLEHAPPEDLEAWRAVVFRRGSAVLNVLGLELSGGPLQACNQAALEGIVSRTWQYARSDRLDLFARLAVYDPHTRIDESQPGNFGRPRRRPHYVNVLFPDGKVAGHELRLAEKSRLRVSGELRDQGQKVSLHEALLRTGDPKVIELISRLPCADDLHEISAQWESLHLLAQAVIVYTAGSRRK